MPRVNYGELGKVTLETEICTFCNHFNDGAIRDAVFNEDPTLVDKAIEQKFSRSNVPLMEIYLACSKGNMPGCGNCVGTFQERVKHHHENRPAPTTAGQLVTIEKAL